jgi:adenylyl-sulfate kinase
MLNASPTNAADTRALRISVHNLAGTDQSALVSQLQRLVLSLPVLAADVTGAPGADVTVVVVDGTNGFTTSARQAAAIARTGGARHIVLAVNTPALSAHDTAAFDTVRTAFHEYVRRLEFATAVAIPLVAGADASGVAWFAGPSLVAHLDALAADLRAASGRIEETTQLTEQFAAHVACIADEELLPGRDYKLKLAGRELTASVTAIKYRLDVDSLHRLPARTLGRGEIGVCTIATQAPVALASDDDVPGAGRFIISDMHSDTPIAVGTVDFALRRGMNVHWQPLTITKELRASLKQQRPCVIWLTGLSGSGKSTLANLVEGWLALRGCHTYLLDGDNVRHGLNKDLGFTAVDRVENIRRVGEVARLFVDAGVIVLCSFISPFRAEREAVRSLLDNGEFIEVHVTAPLEVCEARDPKGLYAKSRAGQLPNFTGIDSPYEAPENADLVLDTTTAPAPELAHRIVSLLQARGIVADDNARERVGRIP